MFYRDFCGVIRQDASPDKKNSSAHEFASKWSMHSAGLVVSRSSLRFQPIGTSAFTAFSRKRCSRSRGLLVHLRIHRDPAIGDQFVGVDESTPARRVSRANERCPATSEAPPACRDVALECASADHSPTFRNQCEAHRANNKNRCIASTLAELKSCRFQHGAGRCALVE